MADRVCRDAGWYMVRAGAVANLFADPQHPYTRQLLAAEPQGEPPPEVIDAPEILSSTDLRV